MRHTPSPSPNVFNLFLHFNDFTLFSQPSPHPSPHCSKPSPTTKTRNACAQLFHARLLQIIVVACNYPYFTHLPSRSFTHLLVLLIISLVPLKNPFPPNVYAPPTPNSPVHVSSPLFSLFLHLNFPLHQPLTTKHTTSSLTRSNLTFIIAASPKAPAGTMRHCYSYLSYT